MTDNDLKKFIEAAKAFTKRATASPEKARDTLVKEGIYQKNGQLTDQYK